METRVDISNQGKIEGETSHIGETFEGTDDVIRNMQGVQNLGNIQRVTNKFFEVPVVQVLIFASLELFCLKEKQRQ